MLLTPDSSPLTYSDSGVAGVAPSYSGGTARDSHPLPFIRSAYVEGDNRKDIVALSSKQHGRAHSPTRRV